MTLAASIWLIVRVLLTALIGLYALHRLQLLWRLVRHRRGSTVVAAGGWASLPSVTLQLPVYNERFVVARLLAAVGRIDYPRELLQIQVLDDSDDATRQEVDEGAERLRRAGFEIEVRRRQGSREGFKAGALAAGLSDARGELVAVFDADFVPDPGFLRRLVPMFHGDDRLGMVQARWGYLNAGASWLTRVQACLLDAHFRIEHEARWRSGCCFNFNGTAGIWRRSCIDAAGGWQGDTLTEDLDLSYRAQRIGWRFLYVDTEVAPSELPADWNAFKSQQFRWAKGAIQTGRKLLPLLWGKGSRLTLAAKFEATMHLMANLAYVVFAALLAGGALAALGGAAPPDGTGTWWWLRSVGFLAMLVAVIYFAAPMFFHGRRRLRWRDWMAVALTLPVAIGLMVNNCRAVIEGWLGRDSPFERTPKVGDQALAAPDRQRTTNKGPAGEASAPYRAAPSIGWSVLEAAVGVVFLEMSRISISAGNWFDLVLLLSPTVGFLWIGFGSLITGLSSLRRPWHDSEKAQPDAGSLDDAGEKTGNISASAP